MLMESVGGRCWDVSVTGPVIKSRTEWGWVRVLKATSEIAATYTHS